MASRRRMIKVSQDAAAERRAQQSGWQRRRLKGGWGSKRAVCINEWQINVEHVWIEHGARGRSKAGQEQSTRQTTMANGGCSQRRRSFKIFLHSSHTYSRHTHTHTHTVVRARFDSVF